jgi:hypothetical protein
MSFRQRKEPITSRIPIMRANHYTVTFTYITILLLLLLLLQWMVLQPGGWAVG